MNRSARQNDRTQRCVSATIDNEIDVHCKQLAVFADRRPVMGFGRMAFSGCRHVLRAVIDQLDGFARFPCQQGRVCGDHRGVFFLASKSAAGFRLNDPDFLRRQIEDRHERFLDVVRTLHRAPYGEPLPSIANRYDSIVLDVELLLRAGLVFAFDDVVGRGPHSVDVALLQKIRFESIVFSPNDLCSSHRFIERDNRGQRLNDDAHGLSGSFGQIFIGVC